MNITLNADYEVWNEDCTECLTVLHRGDIVKYLGHLPGGNVKISFYDGKIGVISGKCIE